MGDGCPASLCRSLGKVQSGGHSEALLMTKAIWGWLTNHEASSFFIHTRSYTESLSII